MDGRKIQRARQEAWKQVQQEYKDDPECCFAFGFEAGYRFAVAPRVEPPVTESGGGFESLPAKPQHTPGPWILMDGSVGTPTTVIANLSFKALVSMSKNEQLANIRLIAAAPDLLEALCKLAELYDAMGAPRGPCRIIADAAIAKATGGAA